MIDSKLLAVCRALIFTKTVFHVKLSCKKRRESRRHTANRQRVLDAVQLFQIQNGTTPQPGKPPPDPEVGTSGQAFNPEVGKPLPGKLLTFN